ncbi:hypothetical protein FFWV33_13840 [Flavobacterium faecale]|uniref:Transporter n=1 Tax=Flavobacterium faecale TaxID=1355330 RepID=A0A2S1LFU8_9FLAO|nr:hypothetical protein [Flavobacterium faecale]AWG22531.1 hypothetical protein FFWV33_13840 [Flavobacterium faecale]
MKKFAPLYAIIAIALFSTSSNAQSPWTKEKGKAYVQVGFSGLFYDTAQIGGVKTDLNADYSDVTTQLYAEYGLTNNLGALVVLPYKFVSVESTLNSTSADLSGLGNITLGLKYKIQDKNWKISTGLTFIANTIEKGSGIDGRNLSTGFAANTYVPYVTAGTSHGKWYYFGNIGYGYMSNGYSDYLKADAEVGYNIIPKGHLILAFNSKNVVSDEKAFDSNNTQWPSYLDRQTYNALGIKFNYEFKQDKFGANFAVFGAFGNDNAPLAPSINIGLYTKL